ncbi:MAG: Phosphoheptose isomerase [Chlamydiales bacterium]|nr:Phosphoheptose isomerase [Chlamydiales bacterium]MCH9635612.1 Phosphoheptose isomerase [Chlamydiales bacterium]MCH9704070.1 SIS domain-containing protein [Chlamydiota bacterium]
MKKRIEEAVQKGIDAIKQLEENSDFIEQVATRLADCFRSGNKLIVAGNGGSLCDAAHFAEELTGYFREERPALPAICLSEPGHITCVGNDSGFDNIFSRSIEALGCEGDIFVGLTTSGNSQNLINAFAAAKKRKMTTVAFLGKGGGKLKGEADIELLIEGFKYSDRIQEAHMAAIHIIIELMEDLLFKGEEVLHEALARRA